MSDSETHESLSNVDKQILIEFYKVQWNDIHDMNNLDWRVSLIFIPLIGALSFVFGITWEHVPQEVSNYTNAIRAISFITYLICLYGQWTVAKGQAMTTLKFKTLTDIEKSLELSNKVKVHSYVYVRPKLVCGWSFWPTIVCRRIVLFIVYVFLGILSFSMIIIPVSEWNLSDLLKPQVWIQFQLWVPVVLALIIISVHYYDYILHIKQKRKCLKCDREIPVASEECPYCKSKQQPVQGP